jgi:tetraprenyl-beta-curcumene synthase
MATVACYLLRVLPQVDVELSDWWAMAADIPAARLSDAAKHGLVKRGNVEGAALFAILVPAVHRPAAIRALVAFQTAYNYLDALSEQPSEDPLANAAQLHQALLGALRPGSAHVDYYAHNPDRDDGGYLNAVLDACRRALAGLPSYPVIAPTICAAAARIVTFQSLNLPHARGGHVALERWASDATPVGADLAWWETAAAGGSSLAVHALIAAGADPRTDRRAAAAIDGAYFPWIGGLHSLLDSLVDRQEDQGDGRPCLLDNYGSPMLASMYIADLAARALDATASLPAPLKHHLVVTAMCSYYLSATECETVEGQTVTRALRGVMGRPLGVAVHLFRAKRLFHALTDGSYT